MKQNDEITYIRTDNLFDDSCAIYKYVKFYKFFPEILDSSSPKSILLTWSHYRTLLQVFDTEARNWYAREAVEQTWSVRTLLGLPKQINTNH